MADTISYQYAALSALQRAADQDELFLAKYSEIEKKDAPCFFWGEVDTTLYDGTLPHRSVPIVTASNNHQHPLSARAEPGRTGNLCGTAIGQ